MTHNLCRKRDKAIHKKHEHGLSIRKLAKLYGVSFQRIQQILSKGTAA
jgi:Mor family transcriptional regulator